MKIVIEDKKLRKLCEDQAHARKVLGVQAARKLGTRLVELRDAPSLFDLPRAYRPHALKGTRAGQFSVDVDKGVRLVVRCADEPPPLDEQQGLDWHRVRTVRIVFIGDYHD